MWRPAKAYLYLGGPSGLGSIPAWTRTGLGLYVYYGFSVAAAGDVNGDGYADVVVGAYGDNGTTGKAEVFLGGAGGLGATPDWTAYGEGYGDGFGVSVASAGDVDGDGYADVVVGAAFYQGSGKAYLFLGGPQWPRTDGGLDGRG